MSRKRPILVVEDNDQDFAVLEMCLQTAGVVNSVDRCASGEEVAAYLTRMNSAPLSEIPLFVFLDLNLRGIHGSEVLRRLKAHQALVAIPVVVLTTSSQVRDIDMSYELGAAGYLTKPLDLDKFEKMIQRVADYWFSCVKLPENAKHSH
jgi:CheY-like chemotaxis protein